MIKQAIFALAIAAILDKPITDVTELLNELTVDQLEQLKAAETAEGGKQRVTLVALIEKQIEELKANPPAAPAVVAEAVAPVDPKKDWRHPDYVGPLTGDQAEWRLQNVPRFQAEAVTK